ncbi:hypothetical protein WUBG_16543, partial [Wuchereria bancrofti]
HYSEHSSRSDDSRGFVSQSSHSGSGGRVPSVNSIFVANSIGPLKKLSKKVVGYRCMMGDRSVLTLGLSRMFPNIPMMN